MTRSWTEAQEDQFRQLSKVLNERRKKPTVVFIEFDNPDTRSRVYSRLERDLAWHSHHIIDLGSEMVVSPVKSISERLKQPLPDNSLVHVFGLENSMFTLLYDKFTNHELTGQINFERGKYWKFPFSILIWTDQHTIKQIKLHAVDFWSWITYFFSFTGSEPTYLPAADLFQNRDFGWGANPYTMQRVRSLEAFAAQLEEDHHDQWTDRSLLTKVNTLILLGEAYASIDMGDAAVRKLEEAGRILDRNSLHAPITRFSYHATYGRILRSIGERERATAFLEVAATEAQELNIREEVAKINLELARQAMQNGDVEKATSFMTVVGPEDKQKFSEESHYLDAWISVARGRYSEAIEHLRKMLDVVGDNSVTRLWVLNSLAISYTALERFRDAEDFMIQALDVAEQLSDGDVARQHLTLGLYFEERKDLNKARTHLEKARSGLMNQGDSEDLTSATEAIERLDKELGQ
ncbi:MAG: tetratricopeptide repeat protein [Acidobacteriota bacterium]|nr:tetratricopeptide repeat protein [Acidobacteriota bacterium]